ncbi:DNA-binding protein [Demequina sp. SYSU T00068]|uniref:DNA-binding protein n=1 Tax=Demequina lignilytica TaxID=3051663 RepID=UPI002607A046|nr:DNA-binding protein [Demequina sp. SYSU T00068]MDN4489243.1 DNA-binding protein [Demequina sp. SYSU T00068]
MSNHDHEVFLTPVQLAARWQVDATVLANWRYQRRGPAFVKIGSLVRYRLDAIQAYEADSEVA